MNLVNPASRELNVNQENNLCCVGGIVRPSKSACRVESAIADE
jgi:flagellar basal body L-ring protein FlgH